VVIGAGPAGLAAAACLTEIGVPPLVLERADTVGPAWRAHYDRLHLHTSRRFSGLPRHPMPRTFPGYPPRDTVVEYLEDYARVCGIEPRFATAVTAIRADGDAWVVETADGSIRSPTVVLATGANGTPNRPSWPGLATFPGPVLHSSEYRSGAPFAGQDVLVVGFGNSGGEIALDLAEHGARPAAAVRGAVNIVPRDILGVPVLAIAIPLSKLPPRLADAIVWPVLKAYYPSYRRLGLRKSPRGPLRQIAETGHVPLLDIGTVRAIRRGGIRVFRGPERVEGRTVRFEGGASAEFDAIVLATGYRPALPARIEGVDSGALGASAGGPDSVEIAPGLYRCGLYVSPTGMLREIGIEALEIARRARARRSP